MEMRGVGAGQGKASQQPDRSLIHPSILFRPVVLERRCRTKECIILIANVLGELDTSGLLCVAQDGVVSCFVETEDFVSSDVLQTGRYRGRKLGGLEAA